MKPISYLSGTPSSIKLTKPENAGESKLAGAQTRSNPFTISTGSLSLFIQQTERISDGKLSPPLFTALTL